MKNIKNIIYLCNSEKGASGGAKIIYHHSEITNSLNNFTSEVLHIKKKKTSKWKASIRKKLHIKSNNETGWKLDQIEPYKNFKYNWFENNVTVKNNFNFHEKTDFVILPEIFAHLADDLLIKNKIKYAIFVQNGYAISSTNNKKKLNKAYNKASFILSYSEDVNQCIKLLFPHLKKKIIKVKCSVDSNKFNSNQKKKNLITYMSRKLPQHSGHVIFFLKKVLPKNWIVKDLNNLSEKKVFNNLCRSKIFLSFSNLEGLGLPAVEAAIAGNFVVGYTGEGGKEYWKKPIFTEIYSGDIKNFVNEILKKVLEKNKNKLKKIIQRKKIIKEFSKENEIKHMKSFLGILVKV